MKPEVYSGPVFSYVRFSSSKQEAGDSMRRQEDAAQKWCAARGLTLDTSLRPDKGISAFRGANLKRGALGQFLAKADEGRVPRGSTLLVENLDRLSREQITASFTLFLSLIVNHGIRVVSLMDGMEYTKESVEKHPNMLWITLGALARGYDESKTKSERVKGSFAEMRRNLPEKKWSTGYPPWLELNKDRTGFSVIESKAAIIRRIFQDFDQGIGVFTIARNLQTEGVGRVTDGKCRWQTSTVQHYLKTRTVVGEFQPMERVGSKRVPVGIPLENYYPKIVDDAVFHRVNKRLKDKKKVRGRRSEGLTNLFRGLVRCAYCGGPMLLRRQQGAKNTKEAYMCDNGFRFQTCLAFSWPRVHLEKTFLEIVESVQREYVITQVDKPDPIEFQSIIARLEGIDDQMKNLLNAIQHGRFEVEIINPRVDALKKEKAELVLQKSRMEARFSGASQVQFKLDLEKFLDVDLNDEKKREILAGVIARMISSIDVYHVGLPSRFQQLMAAKRRMIENGLKGNQVFFKLAKEIPFEYERFFLAKFLQNGVKPYPDFLTEDDFVEMYDDPIAAKKEFAEIYRLAKDDGSKKHAAI
jgi:DNA invertase Pin-like site-specific DNA recombinase